MSFKSDIKNIQRALLKIPGLNAHYFDQLKFPPTVGGKNLAYFTVNVESMDHWDGALDPRSRYGAEDDAAIRQAWKRYQTTVDKRTRDVREVLNIPAEYKFRNLTPKLEQVQKTMLDPEHYKRLDFRLLPTDLDLSLLTSAGKHVKKNLLFGMQDVPVLGMTMNWYIMPDWWYSDCCANFYFEFSMQAKMRTRPVTFKTFPEVQVGSIFGASFGYDATLWNFYEVVERQSEAYIVVRLVQKEEQPTSKVMYNNVRPIPGKYADNNLYRVKLADRLGTPSFRAPDLSGVAYATLYKGGWRDETDIRFV
jgi:hypothetical protein